MNITAEQLQADIERLKTELTTKQAHLTQIRTSCIHRWGDTYREDIHKEGYMIPGDRPGDPGYGGVDRRFDTYVSAVSTPRWKRKCKECGVVQETTVAKPTGEVMPQF